MSSFIKSVYEEPCKHTVIKMPNPMDMGLLKEFQASIDETFEDSCFHVVFDFDGCDSILSAHLGILYQRYQVAKQKSGAFYIIHGSELIEQAFARIGFNKLIKFCLDLEDVKDELPG